MYKQTLSSARRQFVIGYFIKAARNTYSEAAKCVAEASTNCSAILQQLRLVASTMLLEAVLFVCAMLLLSGVAQKLVAKVRNYPPGPTPLPIIGNFHNLGWQPHLSLTEMAQKYGKVFQIFLGHQRTVVISDIVIAREALLQKLNQFAGRPFVYSGSIFSNGGKGIGFGDFTPEWKLQRKIAHGAIKLYSAKLAQLEGTISASIDEVSKLFVETKGRPHDPRNILSLGVINVICNIVFGKKYDLDDPEFQKVVHFNETFAKCLGPENVVDAFPILRFLPFEEQNIKKLRMAVQERDAILRRVYAEHLKSFDADNIRDLTDALISSKAEAGKEDSTVESLKTEHVLMAMSDVFVAGAETTVTSMRWLLIYMMYYPEVQAAIQKELDQVIGKDRMPGLKDRQKLPYLQAAVAEVFRITSIAPLAVPHKATVDTTLQGFHIPKGTTVVLNLWAIHHDPDKWSEPMKFNPDRFLDENGNYMVSSSMSFLPFSAGRRVCLGESLARAELFLFTARLFHQFRFEKVPNQPLPSTEGNIGIVLQPRPFQICVKKRD